MGKGGSNRSQRNVTQKNFPTTDGASRTKDEVNARLVGGGDCQDRSMNSEAEINNILSNGKQREALRLHLSSPKLLNMRTPVETPSSPNAHHEELTHFFRRWRTPVPCCTETCLDSRLPPLGLLSLCPCFDRSVVGRYFCVTFNCDRTILTRCTGLRVDVLTGLNSPLPMCVLMARCVSEGRDVERGVQVYTT
jgi:hypothetical protein